MRRVEHVMGLPVSIDVPAARWDADLEPAFTVMRLADARFSPYRPNSELSRFNRGELASAELSTEFRDIQQTCTIWNQQTDGLFSANYGSQYDPSGLVKGWAVAQAGRALEESGWHHYLINAGGDILAAGRHDDTWSIGLQHPLIKQKLMGSLSVQTGAIATSGTYARGQHVVNPLTGEAATELVSVTVVGAEIIPTDVFATAILAGGIAGLRHDWGGYGVLAIEPDGTAHTNDAWLKLAVSNN